VIVFLPGSEQAQKMDELVKRQELEALVGFLFSNQQFIKEVAEVVGDKYTRLDFEYWQLGYIKKATVKKSARVRERELVENELKKTFVGLLRAVYDLNDNDLPSESKQDKIGHLRAAIVEALVVKILKSRYKEIGTNCQIEINESVVMLPGAVYPKTIDAAGVDDRQQPQQGEMYECKAGSAFIEKRDLRFLTELRRRLDAADLSEVMVALVSFDRRAALQRKFTKLKVKYKHMLSREDLGTLRDYGAMKAFLAGGV